MAVKSKSKWLGELKIVIGQAAPYMTIITALMMAATFYHTTLIEWLGVIGFGLPLWLFIAIAIIGGCTVIWFERKYMVGGYFESWTEQWWDNDNPMKKSMEELQADMRKVKKVLKIEDEGGDELEK